MESRTHLDGLNEAQKQAVLHTEGPLLIVAGAGAGKTKTITHRIVHLIENGVPGRAILAVTFTNKAAGEMRERVRKLLSDIDRAGDTPLVCTFHSLGVRILREFGGKVGVPLRFAIWDKDDSLRAIKGALKGSESDGENPRIFLGAISRQKGLGLSLREYAEAASSSREKEVAEVWRLYETAQKDAAALDFDDLLLKTLRLLSTSKTTRELLQNRWKYLTIDEYQDTNGVQYEIVRLLAGERKNICVVGDIDQNIFSWRGAKMENLLSFERSFPGTKVLTLEENYRSTGTILAAANSVIEQNTRRLPKRLFTKKGTGEAILLFQASDEIAEAWFAGEYAKRLIERGTSPREIAVLYRNNFQSRAFEEAFLSLQIPYRVLGTRFFERKEIKDMISYLRAAFNERSKDDIARIIGIPPRGIGGVTLRKMLDGKDAELPGATRAKVAAFRETLRKIRHALETLPASEALRYALEESGMERMFKEKQDEEHRERLLNVRELVNFAVRFDELPPPRGVEALLEEAALQSDQDELRDDANAVPLMTVHAAKGLEFDYVFITGLEQGLFPHDPTAFSDEERDPEEERRLFYVALTRAGKRLFLSRARSRARWGAREYTLPSEFLDDIDARLIEEIASGSREGDLIT